ncbi:MAG: hypothetical protein M0P31_07125 [Solirubrobacteraceae bacterium]|nr:hypothetical protein [Solirubrobacteraceae bacterium]
MSRLEELHPDQQAVLRLLLKRRMAYADLADVLGIPADQVRERALDAVDGLAPDEVDGLEMDDRDRIAEYLLGQQQASDRRATRGLLDDSAPARTWARQVSAGLRPIGGELPAIPGDGEDVREAFEALDARRTAEGRDVKRSRLGMSLVVSATALLVAVLVLWAVGVFDDDSAPTASTGTTASSTAGASDVPFASGDAATVLQAIPAQINFTAPSGATGSAAKTKGVGLPTAEGEEAGIVFQGEGFRPMTEKRLYAVWLTGGEGRQPVRLGWFSSGDGESPATIDKDGKVENAWFPFTVQGEDGQTALIDVTRFDTIVVSEETGESATPGKTVVSGSLKK